MSTDFSAVARGLWRIRSCDAPSLRLFLVPYAGGSAVAYRALEPAIPPDVEAIALELPGRGLLADAPRPASLRALVRELAARVLPLLDRPWALYGHSLGALVAFEMARHLITAHGAEPRHLIVSASAAPGSARARDAFGSGDAASLLRTLASLGGTPPEALANRELMDLVLPVLATDLAWARDHRHVEGPPLQTDLTVLGGLDDILVPMRELEEWSRHVSGRVETRTFPGGHFYFVDRPRPAHDALYGILRAVADGE
jgi:medium-chain acyl-[acyl-carrier-protein] hydrolase